MKRIILALVILSILIFQETQATDILVVDRDGSAWNPAFTDCWPRFMDALDANGLNYDYWEVAQQADNGPSFEVMQHYPVVIWFTGEVYSMQSTLTVEDEIQLSAYLNNGGKLFLSSQDYLYDRYPSGFGEDDFPRNYLGLLTVEYDVWVVNAPDLLNITGVSGTLAEGYDFFLEDIFSTATREGLYVDRITWSVSQAALEANGTSLTGPCAVQYDAGSYRAFFTTASFAAIQDASVRNNLILDIYQFLRYGGYEECYPYYSGFDHLNITQKLCQQDPCWIPYDFTPGSLIDPGITNLNPRSHPNSVVMVNGDHTIFYAYKYNGHHLLSCDLFIDPLFTGDIFIRQVGAIACRFDFSSATCTLHAGGTLITVPWVPSYWNNFQAWIDLGSDYYYLFFNEALIYEGQFSMQSNGSPGFKVLESFEIHATGGAPLYLDNFFLIPVQDCEQYEMFTAGEYICLQSPLWKTWDDVPGTSEDAYVSEDIAFHQSLKIEDQTNIYKAFSWESFTDGYHVLQMNIMVAPDHTAYLNLQKEVGIMGFYYGLEIFLEADGTGSLNAGGIASASFAYDQGEWQHLEIHIDLDADLCQVWLDGMLIHEYPWSTGNNGIPGPVKFGFLNIAAWNPAGYTTLAYVNEVCFSTYTGVGLPLMGETQPAVLLFPNPVKDCFFLEAPWDIQSYRVYNLNGQLIESGNSRSSRIELDASSWPAGVYLIRLFSQDQCLMGKMVRY
ncbi:MAG: T9SS type A sorting domain-containing protein [Bacteroidetes bacterium]|nr:T9SS type A sorting domain-containing protein [Bacteroidota bacterium]